MKHLKHPHGIKKAKYFKQKKKYLKLRENTGKLKLIKIKNLCLLKS